MKALWTSVPSRTTFWHTLEALYLVHCYQCLSDGCIIFHDAYSSCLS